MLFSNILKASAAASLVLACASVNAQSSWKSSQDLGLYVNPTKGISSNVTIGATPTSSLSKTRLTVKSEAGQGGLRIFNSAGDTKLWLNEKGGLSVGTNNSATTNGLLVSGQTRLRANLIVDNGADINGNINLNGSTNVHGLINMDGPAYCFQDFFAQSGAYFLDQICLTEQNGKGDFGSIKFYNHALSFTVNRYDFSNGKIVPGTINFNGEDFFFGNIGSPNYHSCTVRMGSKLAVGDKVGTNYIPKAQLDVNGDGYFSGKLTCKGQIEVAELKANDIQMDMHNAADYVFDENYNLKSLSEVENYVNEHKHLPGMPSAAEMEENGVSVSKMTNLLLEKVEELTLHMIQLEKENAALKAEVKSLRK